MLNLLRLRKNQAKDFLLLDEDEKALGQHRRDIYISLYVLKHLSFNNLTFNFAFKENYSEFSFKEKIITTVEIFRIFKFKLVFSLLFIVDNTNNLNFLFSANYYLSYYKQILEYYISFYLHFRQLHGSLLSCVKD